MGANLNEKICSQISPADASLVDKKAFVPTCSADRTEASSFEPGEKRSPPSDDLSKQIACLSRSVLAVFILLLSIIISLLKLVQFILGEFVRTVEKPRPPKQPSRCDVEESLQVSDSCGNDKVARVNVQSVEVDPQVFQVVREKQIKVETATAYHVFSGEDATVSNSSPLDSNEELIIIVLSPEIVKSTEVTTQTERAKVDPQTSDYAYQKRNIDTSIRSMDSVTFQLKSSDFTVSVGIANFKFQALLDTGAAVTAVSASIWREYLVDIHPNLNPPARGAVTTVDGCKLVTLGTLVLTFEIGADSFPVKAHVIEGLAFDVIIGRDFLKEFCSGIDFMKNEVQFVHAHNPLPFDFGDFDDDPDVDDSEFVSSVHAEYSFTILPRSEKIVLGKLKTKPANGQSGDACGIVIPRSNLPHRYSIFGAAEIVKVSENGTIPIR